jgi:RHS repeat-associated protein
MAFQRSPTSSIGRNAANDNRFSIVASANEVHSLRDAEMHATEAALAGGGLSVFEGYDSNTGHLQTTCGSVSAVSCDATLASYSYGWDVWGDLVYRTDALAGTGGLTENFCYDQLNRVTYEGIGTTCNATGRVVNTYDALGNIVNKGGICWQGDGCMAYGGSGAGPHAIVSICATGTAQCPDNGVNKATFNYDADGNMTCERSAGAGNCDATAPRFMSWTSFNMAAAISQSGSPQYALTYGPGHERVQQCAPGCASPTSTTLYMNDGASGTMSEQVTSGTTVTWHDYIHADGKLVAEHFVTGSAESMSYFIDDHLGSPAAIVQIQSGVPTVVERDSYDAWGKMRDPSTWAYDASCTLPPASDVTRHFTGHESLASVCQINANARIYDPQIGRFMSADPTTENPYDLQDLNRYSYVLNNPLSLTDPTGNGGLFKNPLLGAVVAIAAAATFEFEVLPFIEGLAVTGAAAGTTGAAAGAAVATAPGAAAVSGLSDTMLAINAGISGGIGGAISTGTLKGAALGGLEAVAMYGVGDFVQGEQAAGTSILGSATADQIVAHGMVGGVFSIGQQHGGFGSRFLAAALSASTEPGPPADWEQLAAGTAISAASGGVGSMLGGGKFANGAITGAFGYLFNGALHPPTPQQAREGWADLAALIDPEQGMLGMGPGEILGGRIPYWANSLDQKQLWPMLWRRQNFQPSPVERHSASCELRAEM